MIIYIYIHILCCPLILLPRIERETLFRTRCRAAIIVHQPKPLEGAGGLTLETRGTIVDPHFSGSVFNLEGLNGLLTGCDRLYLVRSAANDPIGDGELSHEPNETLKNWCQTLGFEHRIAV